MKKFITIGAVALGLALSTSGVNAQTSSDLQAQIDALLAQLAALQSGGTTTVTGPAFVYSQTMRAGMSGPGVATLQGALNAVQDPDIVVDSAFGPATASAVMQFQASQGLSVDGIVGPATGAALAAASTTTIVVPGGDLPEGCTSTSGYSPVTGEACDEETTSSPSEFPTSGGQEASLESESYSMDSEDDAEEGQETHVATIEFDVEDGDAMIERFDLSFFPGDNTSETDPWDTFDTLTLMVDGDEIAEMDIDDEDDWNNDEYTDAGVAGVFNSATDEAFVFRITGLDYVVEEGETAEIEVYLTANSNVDDAGDADKAEWTIFVDDEGIRTIDTAGITSYIGDDTEVATFDVDTEGGDEEIQINSSSNDPDASTLMVDADDKSDWYEVFIFNLEAEENDIDLDNIMLDVTVAGGVYDQVVDDAMLTIDGEEFDDFEVAAGTEATTSADLTFDIDKDFTIDGDDEVEVILSLQFKKQDTNYGNGQTVEAGSVEVEGEGVDDVSDSSSLSGEEHTLLAEGIMVEVQSANTDVTSVDGATNDIVEFTFEIDVTAFESDVYINQDIADIVAAGAAGDVDTIYSIEQSGTNVLTAINATITTSTGATIVAGDDTAYTNAYNGESFYRIVDGDTETFTINISGTNSVAAGQVRALLENIEWTTDDVDAATVMDTETATINSYTSDLGVDAATPFKTVN